MSKLVEGEYLMFYKPENFELYELLPKWHWQCWHKYPEAWLIWPAQVLWQLQALRSRYGPVIVNNWHQGGDLQYCGYRPLNCKVGAKFSLHKWGLAFDMHFLHTETEEVRQDILKNQDAEWCAYINAVEMGTPHLHWDMRNTTKRILEIKG